MKAKAAVLYAPKEMKIEEFEVGPCNGDQILIQLKKATLCPTDIKKYMGDKPDVVSGLKEEGPYILGHEAAGVVMETGEHVTDVKAGDRVAVQPMVSCGECAYCRQEKPNMCLNILGVGGSAGKFGDCIKLMKEREIGGCFSTYLKVPKECVIALPREVDFAAGSLVEPLADAIHSIDAAGVGPEDHIVIIGLGPMGLFHVIAAKYNKAKQILCVDIDEDRLQVAKKLGADIIINSKHKDAVEEVKSLTGGLGADKIFVTSGGKAQGPCTKDGLKMAAKQGTVSLFASAAVSDDELTVSMNYIHYNMLNLTGTVGFRKEDGEKAVRLLASGIFDYKLVRNIEMPLDKIVEGMNLYGKGANLKVGINLE